MIKFITEHKDLRIPLAAGNTAGGQGLRWGVEPMCAVLTEHGIKISASTYYEWVNATPTKRQLRDAEVLALLVAERTHPKTGKLASTLELGTCGGCADPLSPKSRLPLALIWIAPRAR